MPDFLDIPSRPAKPRTHGVTHVIDTGFSASAADATMSSIAEYVDVVRLGWGTAYVTRDLREKLAVYRSYGVPTMLGGTLTELAWLQGKIGELRAWLAELGIEHVEVSSGIVPDPRR